MPTDARLQALAEAYGTPLYVYDLGAVEARIDRLRSAFPGAALRYAVKANPAACVLRTMAAAGVGAEVITLGEAVRAHAAGVPAGRTLVGGPGQDERLRAWAAEAPVAHVSLDHEGQWEAWRARAPQGARFLVRVHPGLDPGTHAHLATGAAGSKFGLPPAAARALATRVQDAGRLAGFHVHAGSMITDVGVHQRILEGLTPLFRAFPAADTLNLGGGFAVPDFPLEALAARVRPWLAQHGASLILEPGRWVTADAGTLLTRVLWRKEGPPTHWITDAGMAQLLRPALYDAHHPIRRVGPSAAPDGHGDVDGPLCENADRLGRERTLAAGPGDLLAVERAGAYGFAMASNYASELRPAEVAVRGDEAWLARRRETPDDLMRPEREAASSPRAD
ncbi:MAG: diaminopimelate decarboxylase [Trueperaceae bacterium]|nr:diaminopimelate decarboxylase [Trueperaceae bacterium]